MSHTLFAGPGCHAAGTVIRYSAAAEEETGHPSVRRMSGANRRWPVIIVGDGPAGIAAAFPLVERGVDVLMLGGAPHNMEPQQGAGTLADMRGDPDQWRMLIGEQYEALDNLDAASPKFRVPLYSPLFRGFNERYRVRTQGFASVGTLAGGGLVTGWGAGVSMFDDHDLAEYPLSLRDLLPSYRRVSKRIGVSGTNDDDMSATLGHDDYLLPPTECNASAQALFSRYQRHRSPRGGGFLLGRGRNAVITRALGDRGGCVHCGRCLWGCPHKAIWAATYDLPALKRHANFKHIAGCFATALIKREDGWRILVESADADVAHFDGTRVMLACGAIGSAKLVLDALGMREEDVPLQTSPVAGFALLVARTRPWALADHHLFALSQLCFQVAAPQLRGGYAFGHLFPAEGIPAAEFVRHAGASYPLSRNAVRHLQPLLLVGNCYFDGAYAKNALRLTASGAVAITGGIANDLPGHAAAVRKRLAAEFRRLRAFLPARGFRLSDPGADVHYGATVPMRRSPRPNEANELGEVRGLPRVHVVDGAALTRLAAKPHTFTIMANADRIGMRIAASLRGH